MKMILSPSILSADFWDLERQVSAVEESGTEYLHIDVMDGMFVPSISFGMPVIETLRKHTKLVFDVHLMIERPERYLEEFAKAGADIINFHLEATDDPEGCISKVKDLGKKVGITIKPNTPAKELEPFLDKVDMVLIMTVEPGFGGQKLIPSCLDKVKEVRAMVDEKGLDLDIEIDGGVTIDNLAECISYGTNVIVAGSAVFKGDIKGNLDKMNEIMKKG